MQFMCKVPHHLLRSRQFLVPSYLRYRTTNELAKNSSQTTIASFIENDGIIRVGGCLTVSQWPYGTMHSVMKAYTLDSQYYYLRPDYDFGRWGAMPSQQRSITCICAKSITKTDLPTGSLWSNVLKYLHGSWPGLLSWHTAPITTRQSDRGKKKEYKWYGTLLKSGQRECSSENGENGLRRGNIRKNSDRKIF